MTQATKPELPADYGHRRFLSWGMDYDSRALILNQTVNDLGEEAARETTSATQKSILAELKQEFGEHNFDVKLANFKELDSNPFSVIAHHNMFYRQARNAYVMEAYYPALVGACALGERILNHLILDLREFYRSTPEYKNVYKKKSFDNWHIPISTLDAWGVLLPDVGSEFEALAVIRNRSVHFNPETYLTLKADALAAILHLRRVLELQFGMGLQPWYIRGTAGHQFIKRDFESNPFVRTYLLPHSPLVGFRFAMSIGAAGWEFYDLDDYGEGELTDEDFAQMYNDRKPDDLVTPYNEIAVPDETEGALGS